MNISPEGDSIKRSGIPPRECRFFFTFVTTEPVQLLDKQQIIKTILRVIWISVILACVLGLIFKPEAFTPEAMASFLQRYEKNIFGIYLLLSIVRGLTMIPTTPLVIAGTLALPEHPHWVLAISMIGILATSAMIYRFSDYLGFAEYFEKKNPKAIERIKKQLEKPTGVIFIFFWSIAPIVPTDVISYVAGSIGINFTKFIIPLFLGHLVLFSIVVYGSDYIFGLFGF